MMSLKSRLGEAPADESPKSPNNLTESIADPRPSPMMMNPMMGMMAGMASMATMAKAMAKDRRLLEPKREGDQPRARGETRDDWLKIRAYL